MYRWAEGLKGGGAVGFARFRSLTHRSESSRVDRLDEIRSMPQASFDLSFKLSRAAITKDHIGPSEPHFKLHQSIATHLRRRILVVQPLNNS
jgi:hypothetical protein